jgi:hypothetical protein
MSDYPDFDPSRPTLPEPYLIALGRVTYLWTSLEDIMNMSISKLMGISLYDPKSAAILTHMSRPQRMDALETLIDLRKDGYPHLNKFSNIKPILKKAQEGRNVLLHGRWTYDDKDNVVRLLRISSRGKLRLSSDPIEVAEIEAVFTDIGTGCIELLKLILNK